MVFHRILDFKTRLDFYPASYFLSLVPQAGGVFRSIILFYVRNFLEYSREVVVKLSIYFNDL